jgi:ATP phosphoribosyltransferase regulatory subunit
MTNKYLEYMLYESDTDPIGLPDGITFLSDARGDTIDDQIQSISNIFRGRGYNKVIPPIFEYYETFEKGSGYSIARKSFSFKDKDGKLLSLRYDMTTPIARMVSMKHKKEDLPLKFYYREDVFREQPLHTGKPRQLRQVGLEFIGEPGIDADVEVINILGEALAKVRKNYRIVLGDVKLYTHILSQLKLTQHHTDAVNASFVKKDTTSLGLILDQVEGISQYKSILQHLPYMVGTPKKVLERLKGFSELGFSIYTDRLMSIIDQLDKSVRKNIIVDLGLVKDFSYYTSTTIEGYVDQVGYAVANGGRYDQLFKAFGQDFPAVGFAIDISYFN